MVCFPRITPHCSNCRASGLIRRQRCLTDPVDDGVDIVTFGRAQSDGASAVNMPLPHLQVQTVIAVAKDRSSSDLHLLARVHQNVPSITIE